MTKLIEIPDFYLEEGIKFSQCFTSDRCPSGIKNGSTAEAGYVDLVIELDAANEPVKANAYQPDIGACSRDAAVSSACIGNFQFERTTLAALIKDPIIEQRLRENEKSQPQEVLFPGQPSGKEGGEMGGGSISSGNPHFFDPSLILGLVGGAAFTATFTAVRYLIPYVRCLLFQKKPIEYKRLSKTSDTSEMPEARQSPMPTQAAYITKEIERQLSGTKQKVGILIKEVEELKTDLIDLRQKGNMPSIKASSVVSRGSDVSFSMQEPQGYPPVLPPPLSLELIKQAVTSWNYQAIGSYELDFVTETSESREGLTESKTFAIDGNQSQAASRSTSEFIAISCQNTTYLIPNILQNAADPARTINRHLERIYKRGVGADPKILAQLATVRKSGNCYELVEMGQVS
jgi:hypothetical protein